MSFPNLIESLARVFDTEIFHFHKFSTKFRVPKVKVITFYERIRLLHFYILPEPQIGVKISRPVKLVTTPNETEQPELECMQRM